MSNWWRRWYLTVLVGVVIPAFLYVGYTQGTTREDEGAVAAFADDSAAAAPILPRVEREIVLIYYTASFCAGGKKKELPGAVRRVVEEVRQAAKEAGVVLRVVGVSIDIEPEVGLKWLRRLDVDFNEMTAGSNWLNVPTIRYVWDTGLLSSVIPQVVLLERVVRTEQTRMVVEDERSILTTSGADQIIALAKMSDRLRAAVSVLAR